MVTEQTLIGDIAVRNVYTILPEASAIIAAKVMVDNGIRHLVVVDDSKQVIGVLSQRSILKQLSPWLSQIEGVPKPDGPIPFISVEDVMTSPAITARADDTIQETASLMAAEKLGCMPVVDGENRIAGIVSVIDVLRFISRNGAEAASESSADDAVSAAPSESVAT
jgi:acetoin utilization protein AcuB